MPKIMHPATKPELFDYIILSRLLQNGNKKVTKAIIYNFITKINKKYNVVTRVYSPLGTLGNVNSPSTPDLTRHNGVSTSVFFLIISTTSAGISSHPGKFWN